MPNPLLCKTRKREEVSLKSHRSTAVLSGAKKNTHQARRQQRQATGLHSRFKGQRWSSCRLNEMNTTRIWLVRVRACACKLAAAKIYQPNQLRSHLSKMSGKHSPRDFLMTQASTDEPQERPTQNTLTGHYYFHAAPSFERRKKVERSACLSLAAVIPFPPLERVFPGSPPRLHRRACLAFVRKRSSPGHHTHTSTETILNNGIDP